MKIINAPEYSVVIPERIEWQNVENLLRQHDLVWYTDGSKTKDGVSLGIYNKSMQISISTSRGNLMTVYQAEILALSKCIETMLEKQIKDKNIVICSDSKSALLTLKKDCIQSKIAHDCSLKLNKLAKDNKITLMWVSGQNNIEEN